MNIRSLSLVMLHMAETSNMCAVHCIELLQARVAASTPLITDRSSTKHIVHSLRDRLWLRESIHISVQYQKYKLYIVRTSHVGRRPRYLSVTRRTCKSSTTALRYTQSRTLHLRRSLTTVEGNFLKSLKNNGKTFFEVMKLS